jgi:hypothetical protein
MNRPNGDGGSVFDPQRESWGGLTPDPDEYIGFPGDGGTVWGPD